MRCCREVGRSFGKGLVLLLVPVLLLGWGAGPAVAAKDIVVDWSTGEVTVERDEPLSAGEPEPEPDPDCCREAERLRERLDERLRQLRRAQLIIRKLRHELAEEERISRRLNDLLKTCR